MSAADVSSIVSQLSGDLTVIGAGVLTLASAVMGGLWIKRMLGW